MGDSALSRGVRSLARLVAGAVLPTSVLYLLPQSMVEIVLGHAIVSLGGGPRVPRRLLPLSCVVASGCIFRFTCLDARHSRHPFVRRVYASAGYRREEGQRSLVLARAGRYDLLAPLLRPTRGAAGDLAAALPRIALRGLREMGAVYALSIALASRGRAGRGGTLGGVAPAAWLRQLAASLLFYTGAFGTIRVINEGIGRAAAAARVGAAQRGRGGGGEEDARRQAARLRVALPALASCSMFWVGVDSLARQRAVSRFTLGAAATTGLTAAGLRPPHLVAAALCACNLARPARAAFDAAEERLARAVLGGSARAGTAPLGGARALLAAALAALLCAPLGARAWAKHQRARAARLAEPPPSADAARKADEQAAHELVARLESEMRAAGGHAVAGCIGSD